MRTIALDLAAVVILLKPLGTLFFSRHQDSYLNSIGCAKMRSWRAVGAVFVLPVVC
jgi:hypothetical protein